MKTFIFLTISFIFFNGIAIIIPKRLTKIEMLTASSFTLLMQLITDITFDLKYDLYGYFNEGLDLISFVPFFGIYPAFSIIMLNYYPYEKSTTKKLIYIIKVTVFCLVYEWLSLHTKFFYYRNWSLFYSAICYPPLILLHSWYLKLIRKFISFDYLKK